jgi:Flp pilus assembly protein TadG
MTNKLQRKQKEYGQSMVELALTFTILLVLLAGTVDLGRAFFTWLEMRDAAQEGASYASICPTGNATSRVLANLNPPSAFSVNVSPGTSQGSTKTVTVETNLPITMPFLSTVLGSPTIHIKATINDTILTAKCP